eukprot:GHUV01042011.1.p1 GENE.GHUV01042011.1~~GHUV01042011.1.p1  ORF type:complete len:101 (+),score=30.84 GHUV01042011.1:247-549(+)
MAPLSSKDLQSPEVRVGLSETAGDDLVPARDATITVLDAPESDKLYEDEDVAQQTGWRAPPAYLSLPEAHGTISMHHDKQWWRQLLAFAGCGTIISVGYM